MPLQSNSTFSLGPLPWSNDTLIEAFWKSPFDAHKKVDEHPGRDLHEREESIKAVLRIFKKASRSFLECLDLFQIEVNNGNLFHRKRKHDLKAFEIGFQEDLYILASSAMTLADQCRALSRKIELSGYEDKKTNSFLKNARHRFIQELRNDLIHVTLHKPNWQINYSFNRNVTSRFFLWPAQLSRSYKYNSLARSYLSKHPKGIDLGDFIISYSNDINDFYSWFHEAFDLVAGPQIADYKRCVKSLKAVSARQEWNLLFHQVVIPKKIDPYSYLERYLSPDELDRVYKLPFRSRQQVDLIISLVDEHEACDSNLRETVYKAFGISNTQPVSEKLS